MLDRDKYLSEGEARKLRDFCEGQALRDLQHGRSYWVRRWCIIDTLLGTGMRASEVRLLRINDLSLGREPTISCIGKGKRKRTVPISGKLKKHLKEYIAWKRLLNEGTDPDDYLFTNRLNKPYCLMGIQQLFKTCAKGAGLRPCYSIHSTRHTTGFRLYGKSRNLRLVQVILGHKRSSTTEIYCAVDPGQLVECMENLW